MDKVLEAVAKCIEEFLNKHGGMANGYDTYVEGVIERGISRSLAWHTPEKDTLTGKEVKVIGRELDRRIRKILKKLSFSDKIYIVKKHIEHGCFWTWVEKRSWVRVRLT